MAGLKMAYVILICGKICSGKTTYAKQLAKKLKAVVLSIDEIMLMMFGQHCGEMHDVYAERTKKFLLEKSICLAENGIPVTLDFGPWTKQGRLEIRDFYRSKGIDIKLHYIDIDDKMWYGRIKKRNSAIKSGSVQAYYIDENLAEKFRSRFEIPENGEIDVYINAADINSNEE